MFWMEANLQGSITIRQRVLQNQKLSALGAARLWDLSIIHLDCAGGMCIPASSILPAAPREYRAP